MKITRILVSITLIFGIMFTSPAARAANPEELCSEMLSYYYYYAGDGMADIERLLLELEEQDADQAAQWRNLMEAWHYAHSQINFRDDTSTTLPDNLPDDNSLCIVVMGYQLSSRGTMQDELIGRMEVALEAAKQYPNAYILCTGGATGANSSTSEASAMGNWLMSNGIDSSRIILEKNAISTEQNAINSLKILKADYPEVRHLAIISSDYHIIRSCLVFAARQAAVGGEIIDIAGHACYNTSHSTSMSYDHQAQLIAMMTGVKFAPAEKPTLSQVTGLSLSGINEIIQGQNLGLTATATYNTDFSRDVTQYTVFTGFDPTTPGVQTVQASFEENGTTVTAEMEIELIAAPEAPTDSAALSQPEAPEDVTSPESAAVPKDAAYPWLVGIAVVLFIALLVIVYELRQQYLRAQRKKRRRRQKMNLE